MSARAVALGLILAISCPSQSGSSAAAVAAGKQSSLGPSDLSDAELARLSPIERAARLGDLSSVKLSFNGAGASARRSALYRALEAHQLEVLDWLLANGGDADIALDFAVRIKDARAVDVICRHGPNANQTDDFGNSLLSWASSWEFFPVVRRDNPALAKQISLDLVRSLLACGADPRRHVRGPSALANAILLDDPRVVELLLKHGAPVNEPEGWPMRGAVDKDPRIFELLLNAGADVTARDRDGRTVLERAACPAFDAGDTLPALRLLLQTKLLESEYTKALMCATYGARPDMVTLLLAAGADPNQPLELLLQLSSNDPEKTRRYVSIIDLLFESGARFSDRLLGSHYLRAGAPPPGGEIYARLEKSRDQAARDCLAHEKSDVLTPNVPSNSTPGEPSSDGRFPAAQFRTFDDFPRLGSLYSISPDGRWVAYKSYDRSWLFYSVIEDAASSTTAPSSAHPRLTWSADSQRAKFDQSETFIDLAHGTPVLSQSGFQPGPCFTWDVYRKALDRRYPPPREEWVLPPSPRKQTDYELVQLDGDQYAVRAKDSPEPHPVFAVDRAQLRREMLDKVERKAAEIRADPQYVQKWLARDPNELRKDLRKHGIKINKKMEGRLEEAQIEFEAAKAHPEERMEKLIESWRTAAKAVRLSMFRFAPSPTGRYLYLEILASASGFPDSHISRHLVLDLQTQPARGWEIKGRDAHWHPNGRELYFATPTGEVDQLKRQKLSLAVARFP